MEKPLFQQIFSIKQKCSAREEAIRKALKLTHSEFHGLLSLNRHRAISGIEFAEKLNLSQSRASRVVSVLLDRRFIQTEPSPTDRRTQLISLSREGSEMLSSIEARLQQCERRVLDKYSDQDVRVIKWALGLLDEAL